MAQVGAEQFVLELDGVGQVAVMGQGDTERRVDVERLRLGGIGTAGGRITDMADPDIAGQVAHVAGADHIADQAVVLAQEQAAEVAGDDARRILAAMLQYGETVEKALVDRATSRDTDNSAHLSPPARAGRPPPSFGERFQESENSGPAPAAGNPATRGRFLTVT